MATPVALKCPECAAPLDAGGALTIKCAYCGATVRLGTTERPVAPAPPAAGPVRVVSGSIVLVALLGVGTAWLARRAARPHFTSSTTVSTRVTTSTSSSTTGQIAGLGAGEIFQWDPASADPPWPGRVNDDGVEDVVGTYRVLAGGDGALFAAAWDGATREALWRVGPLARMSNQRAVRLAVSGDRVLVTDEHLTARVLDLASGRQLGTAALADRAEHLCASAEGPPRFFIEAADRTALLITVEGGRVEAARAAKPAWCTFAPPALYSTALVFERMHAGRRTGEPRPTGMRVGYTVDDGARGVAFGVRSPGTGVPMVAGFDRRTGKLAWTRQLSSDPAELREGEPSPAALGDGLAVTTVALADGTLRLEAFDAATGAPRWQAGLGTPFAPQWIRVGAGRVYVVLGSALLIHDARSGARLATIGQDL